jgi:hypothetical protein
MEDCLFVATIDHIEDSKEAGWNEWYDRHTIDIVNCPGFLSGTRYVTQQGTEPHGYLTIYEMTGPEALTSGPFLAHKGWGPFEGHVRYTVGLYRRLGATTLAASS